MSLNTRLTKLENTMGAADAPKLVVFYVDREDPADIARVEREIGETRRKDTPVVFQRVRNPRDAHLWEDRDAIR